VTTGIRSKMAREAVSHMVSNSIVGIESSITADKFSSLEISGLSYDFFKVGL